MRDGFITVTGDSERHLEKPDRPVTAPMPSGSTDLDDEIILSEAKFLLNDFSVDSFGTQAQPFVDEIRACKSVRDLRLCLSAIFTAAEKQCPNRLPVLLDLIREINETA
jgi:hypothetical protein